MRVSVTPTSGMLPSTPAAWATSNILAVATGRIIRMHAVDPTASTPGPLALLEGHTAPITIVISLPGMRIASAGEDGTVRIWDVVTGQSLRIFDLARPVLHMTHVSSEELLCLTSTNLLQVRLTRHRARRGGQLVKKLLSSIMSSPTRVVSSADGSIVAVSDATNVHLTGLGSGRVTTTIRCRRVVTALAIARDGNTLAVADESGVISLYAKPRNYISEKRRLIQWEEEAPAQLHWHAGAPQALSFAHEDAVLLSAGREAVLVTWHLSPTLFGTRTFLPRLRSAISAVSVSPDAKMYAISQTDNAVRIVDQLSSGVINAIRAVPARLLTFSDLNPKALLASRVSPQYTKTCTVAPDSSRHGKVWVAGAGPCLQLFDAFSGSVDDEFQIIPRNSIIGGSRTDGKVSGSSSAVVHGLAVHSSGLYLATIDSQDMGSSQSKRYSTDTAIHTLKFWRRKAKDQSFVLDAVVTQPHGSDYPISSMCFHPSLPLLATASSVSKTFKIWRAIRRSREGRQGWRNEVDMEYKNMSCNKVCFSSDGSLLLVACEHVLTMWEVEDCLAQDFHNGSKPDSLDSLGICPETSLRSLRVEFLHTLIHPPAEEHIISISFAFKSVPLLIAVTRNGIYVWHALSQSIWWSTRIRSDARKLAVDPHSGRFALQLVIPSVGAKGQVSDKEGLTGSRVQEITGAKSLVEVEAKLPLKSVHGEKNGTGSKRYSFPRTNPENQGVESDSFAPTDHEQLTCTDRAVAIYDASSPIPLHIHRLATGAEVTALAFVSQPGQTEGNSATLLCIDSRLEVLLFGTNDDTPSPTRKELVEELKIDEANRAGNLKKVLGQGNDNTVSIDNIPGDNSSDPLSTSTASPVVDKAFRKYFYGPTHIQAPVAVNSFEFVRTLLLTGQEDQGRLGGQPRGRNMLVKDSGLGNDTADPLVTRTKRNSDDRDSKEIRAFCVSAVRKATEKPIPTR